VTTTAQTDRATDWAAARRSRVRGHNPWLLAVETLRSAQRHRITGHAAEMAFFAVVTLVPSTVAVGAALSAVQRVVGPARASGLRDTAIGGIRTLLGPQLTDGVVDPFVRAQLAPSHGGVALGGLLVAWWLSSHLFAATGHALDRAYGATDPPPTWRRRIEALAFGLAAVVIVAGTLGLAVFGPAWGRWLLLPAVLFGFLVCLYRLCPNVSHSWRSCVPGAVLAMVLWALATVAFRVYLGSGLGASRAATAGDEAVAATAAAVSAVVATVVWAYASAVVVLLGGELNARLRDVRAGAVPPPAS